MTTPAWVDAVTGVLVAVGGLAALIGALGILRLGSFFQRVHAPTLGATLGTWCLALATVGTGLVVRGQLFVHAALIAVFIALTAPITTISSCGPRSSGSACAVRRAFRRWTMRAGRRGDRRTSSVPHRGRDGHPGGSPATAFLASASAP